ncbi:unnamed protein product [Ceratitis capitata]|uniref:(Mediterranean fruit fly) hypothetical protein n=1 Tax=Ceratitis capitata TaxID=7213 RepID=A0A811UG79_CERCA|nr:unnamed protein product [Ceratitis capitata]
MISSHSSTAQNLQTVTAQTSAPIVTLTNGGDHHQVNGVSGLGIGGVGGLGGILPHSMQMLKNRKNAKAPKINLNDCSSDVKYGKSLKTPPQLLATLTASGKNANSGCGGGVSGVCSENMTNTGGGKSPANATGSATVTAPSMQPMQSAMVQRRHTPANWICIGHRACVKNHHSSGIHSVCPAARKVSHVTRQTDQVYDLAL